MLKPIWFSSGYSNTLEHPLNTVAGLNFLESRIYFHTCHILTNPQVIELYTMLRNLTLHPKCIEMKPNIMSVRPKKAFTLFVPDQCFNTLLWYSVRALKYLDYFSNSLYSLALGRVSLVELKRWWVVVYEKERRNF